MYVTYQFWAQSILLMLVISIVSGNDIIILKLPLQQLRGSIRLPFCTLRTQHLTRKRSKWWKNAPQVIWMMRDIRMWSEPGGSAVESGQTGMSGPKDTWVWVSQDGTTPFFQVWREMKMACLVEALLLRTMKALQCPGSVLVAYSLDLVISGHRVAT